jgi:hypothetical protein
MRNLRNVNGAQTFNENMAAPATSQFQADFVRNQSISKMGQTHSSVSDPNITDASVTNPETSRVVRETPLIGMSEKRVRNELLATSYCAAPIFSLDSQDNSLLPEISKKL